ncbi:MAG: helix-turn-helix transcriptional regulator [Chitinophagaceae bacterium]|nr:helix-turn-helix transcriptional regulator [Chitinophagaceae bacterium]
MAMTTSGNLNNALNISFVNADKLAKAAFILRALNNPIRKKIFDHLLDHEHSSVTHLIIKLRLEQSVISQHLAIMRKAKIVTFLKTGKFVYYYLNKDRVVEIKNCINSLVDTTSEAPIRGLSVKLK